MAESTNQGYINPQDFYNQEMESWSNLWDSSKSLYENTFDILSNVVWLPQPEIFTKLATIYILTSVRWSKVLPILLCYGEQGSGKSTIGFFANKIRGQSQIFSPSDSFASIRNELTRMRWVDPDTRGIELEGAILIWDNIYASTITENDNLKQLLLCGYNRQSSTMRIATLKGENINFDVFCPKILSSVEPLYLDNQLLELKRRLLIIPHKPYEKFSNLEKAYYAGKTFGDRIQLDSISWDGIHSEYDNFWSDSINQPAYASIRNSLTKRGKKDFTLPENINDTRWTIIIDLITTGILLKAWDSNQEAIDFFEEYFRLCDVSYFSDRSALKDHLIFFIEEQAGADIKRNEIIKEKGGTPFPVLINTKALQTHLDNLFRDGAIEVRPVPEIRDRAMRELGWKLTKLGWTQI
jgi:hypothetical protein